ncbi:transcription antitermination protein, partial [Haloplanus litoreus]
DLHLHLVGSSSSIYADYARRVAAAAADRFESWAADADDEAAPLFSDLAATAADRRETVDSDTDPAPEPADRRTYETLAGLDGAASRLGGALGHSLVTDRTAGQMVGFFVGDADPSTAGTFRDLRSAAADDRDRIVDALDSLCDDEEDWNRARRAATAVVEAAYEDYVETLESMGIKPKNVC